MIIGITGETGSGKDTVAGYLVEYGFLHYSLSDVIREKLREQGKPLDREHAIAMGNALREKHGDSVLAMEILKKIETGKDYVVTSIRHPAEIGALKQHPEFVLVKINTPQRLRYERWRQRQDASQPIEHLTFADFQALDAREYEGGIHGQNLRACMEMAHDVIMNDSSKDVLKERVERIREKLKKGERRLSWDEYFLGIMREVGKRATCDRGKSGCLIVKNKRILTTGYVGSPIGLAHCDDAGHLMHEVLQDGVITQHCIRTTHAEQNALLQAARHGISVEGGTLYCKMEPCHVCAKMIINAGIKRVVAEKRYQRADLSRQSFKEAGVQLDVVCQEVETYCS